VSWLFCLGCGRNGTGPAPAALLSGNEAARADEAKLKPYMVRIDRWAAEVTRLIAEATAAAGQPQQLVPVRKAYLALAATARDEMTGAEKALTADQKRTLQAYFGEQLAPLVGQLQPLLFPALLVDLPQGATPAVIAPPPSPTPAVQE
jgi:hypothetical protein